MTTLKNPILRTFALLFITSSFFLTACIQDDAAVPANGDFGIFRSIDATTVEMAGVIDSYTLDDFNYLIEVYPNIEQINMNNVPGSEDDEINLQVAKKVHDLGIDIHLMDNAEIASGGVDFFLAGEDRTMGSNTRFGVHSWADGRNEATDFPVGHAEHQPYIDFFMAVGFTRQQAEDFYYFTINVASADDIHWMTDAEILKYGFITK